MAATLTIREVAAATGTTPHTLRYYERVGLMCVVPRAASGHRRYGPEEMRWIAFLLRMHQSGMSIQRMLTYARLYRAGDATIPARRRLLADHRREVAGRLQGLRDNLALIDKKLAMYARWERDRARAGGRGRRSTPELRLHAAGRARVLSIAPRERRVRAK